VAELAALLNLSTRTIQRLVKHGTVPCIRIGAAVRLDPAQVADWLRQRIQSTGGKV